MEKYTNTGYGFYAFFSSAEFRKTMFYQNLEGPYCLSNSLVRLENESKKLVDYSFPAFVLNFFIGYVWHFNEIRSVYISFYTLRTLGNKRIKTVITSRNLGQAPALGLFLV